MTDGSSSARTARWSALVHPKGSGFSLLGRRERSASALLSILAQLALILIWLNQTHVDNPWAPSGIPDAVLQLQLAPLASGNGRRSTAPARPRKPGPTAAPTPAPAPAPQEPAPVELPAPIADALKTLPVPQEIPIPAPTPVPQTAKKDEPAELSAHDAAEFARQWAQLQDDLQKKAVENIDRHGLQSAPEETPQQREMAQQRQKDKTVQTLLASRGQRVETPQPELTGESSIFAGELCTTGSNSDREVQLALPCVGDDYVTDFSWHARVHAPNRGETLVRPVDPSGRVFVRDFKYAAATLAAFAEATAELRKIQVTVRMAYLPDLRLPIQLLSRDNRVGAIAAEAFANEAELAEYLRTWAGNVRRWTAPRPANGTVPTPVPATPELGATLGGLGPLPRP